MNSHDLSIYIHIPFCKEKCFYCDFLSFRGKDEYFEQYKLSLMNEITEFASKNSKKYIVRTIFIGGGTPSIVPIGYIGDIMNLLYEKFEICNNAEITIESNVGTLSYNKLLHFKESGINRLSLGLQTTQNQLLTSIGRIHTFEQFITNYNDAKKIGFDNINIDLMFSLPNQTLKHFEETLNIIASLEPEHISVYSLILEEGTKFFDMYQNGNLTLPSDELDRSFYYLAIEILKKNGYNIYEISNFSKLNRECRHNIVYWKRKEYIGFGLGSSSLIGNSRMINTPNFNEYINNNNDITIEVLEKKHMYSEFIFLGLRMTEGIKKSEFRRMFDVDILHVYKRQINKFLENGLLLEDGDRLLLSKRGIDLSNVVFTEFI